MAFDLMKVANAVAMPINEIITEVDEFRSTHSKYSTEKLAKEYSDKIIRNYTSFGVVTALPSVIPGLGTATQLVIEAGTVSGDLALMLRWMHKLCCGVGYIYGRNMNLEGNQDLVKILGLWCGVIKAAQPVVKKIATKAVVAQFDRHVTGKMLTKINQRVGAQIVTKYGTKRGGLAFGKLIPFGVGAGIAGTFNFCTMKSFAKSAINYYAADESQKYEIV